jgi:hypothetical protein
LTLVGSGGSYLLEEGNLMLLQTRSKEKKRKGKEKIKIKIKKKTTFF